MKKNIEMFNNFTAQKNVLESLLVSVFNLALLIVALVAASLESKMAGVGYLSLVITFCFGSLLIRKLYLFNTEYYHLLPFLFFNWFIGCFALNIGMNVFENLSLWVYLTTLLYCISIFFVYGKSKNSKSKNIWVFINGMTIIINIYFTVYLIPIAPVSVPGILVLGIGFYGLVPAVVLSHNLHTLIRNRNTSNGILQWFGIGIALPIIGFAVFAINLQLEVEKINKFLPTKSFDVENNDIPNYIKISQNLKPNFYDEILLKKDIVYVETDRFFSFDNFQNIGNQQFNERKIHNPIINVAFALTDELNISTDDQINILKSNFDKRLATEEQLWSGEDLFTKNIKEDVKLYPAEHLAYAEITIDVACLPKSWGQKEAIYSFQLPEGGVATSLSLWVNGIERKGILTTKEKAAAAYKQIVGVEARDPSLMQWREGNRIVVRVFPVSDDVPRTFKCGFTTPLKLENQTLTYHSIQISGPNISKAKIISRLQISGNNAFDTSKNFDKKGDYFINNSDGLEDWTATISVVKTEGKPTFIWNQKAYIVSTLTTKNSLFTPAAIVLDLNKNWSALEVLSILKIKKCKAYVYFDKDRKEITTENYMTIIEEFENLQYALLPMYNFEQNSLVITKSGSISANFEELKNTAYLQKLKLNTKNKSLKVINISRDINPFWQTIKEQDYVSFYQSDLKNVVQMIEKQEIRSLKTDENVVNLEMAGIKISETQTDATTKITGSNHIFRMYAFAKILQEQVEIQNDSLAHNKFVDFAKQANIVSPISSLIVLETNVDYANNGIDKNENTIGNASIHNDGAVPEPYEWVLIILSGFILIFYFKKKDLSILNHIKW